MPNNKSGGLEIEKEAHGNYFSFWLFQTITLGLLIVFLAAAVLGLFGNGLISRVTTSTEDNTFSIEYEKFARIDYTTTLTVTFSHQPKNPVIAISSNYFQRQFIKQISPTPVFVEVVGNQSVYHFVGQAEQEIKINFIVEPTRAGWNDAEIVVGNKTLALHQLVYP